MSEETITKPTPNSPAQTRRFRAGATIIVAVAAGIVLWLVLRDNGNSSNQAKISAVSPGQIRTLAASVNHPVFWVGPSRGSTYELTQQPSGTIIVRYLPPGVTIGTSKPYLSVATYPFSGAFAALQKVAKQKGNISLRVPNGGIATIADKYPNSVHVAYPGVDYQLEVYDPRAGKATSLVRAGRLVAVGNLQRPAATLPKHSAVTAAGLTRVAVSLHHPIYWLGRKPSFIYELTQGPGRNITVRYLPRGTKIGTATAYTAVGTYPFPGAYQAIKALVKKPNTAELKVPGGGVAVFNTSYPSSIHLAYPGSAFQVEVFDPSPKRAREFVTSGQVSTVG
jgi:hypothetical protein